MKKRLIPNTIIPEDLYVDRVADKQLLDVIEDMGRPGYVLVARQMGKTNLLINAKRKLGKDGDIIAYIDLSNRYETDRECFRSIIDTILDSNVDVLEDVADKIYSAREINKLNSHREHAKELRLIINSIPGRLIVNLDEVDSLTPADYSDKIFAHIRSVYFERVNFEEYERLSYIISGVAEPSEIIKDKSISPFNIGQKILLGDFSFDEFKSFVSKAGLDVSDEVIMRVFYWANGNPRLSWDICSSIEDALISGLAVSSDEVDKIVNDLYFVKYDRPPVDHIRSLVQSDKELRESVIAINYDKPDILSDRIKNRMYLAGILGSDFEHGDIRIKNRIIESALDEAWLSEVDKVEKLSMTKAEELFTKGKYAQAEEIYSVLVGEHESGTAEHMGASYKLGVCYFHMGSYKKAISTYADALYDKEGYSHLYMDQIYTLGMSHYILNEDDEAVGYFDEIIEDAKSPFYYEALMNKAAILVRTDMETNKGEAISLNEIVIEKYESGETVKDDAIAGAYYNVAVLAEATEKDSSYDSFCKSANSGSVSSKVTPLISAILLRESSIDEHLPEIVDSLSSGSIALDYDGYKTGLEINTARIVDLVMLLISEERGSDVGLLLDVIKDYCLEDKANFASILFEMGVRSLASSSVECSVYLFEQAVALGRDYSTADAIFNSNKYLFYIDSKNIVAAEQYFKGFQNYTESSDQIDVRLFEKRISQLVNDKEFERAVKYSDFIIDLDGLNSHANCVKLLSILYLKVNALQDRTEVIDQALRLRDIINKTEIEDLQLTTISEETLKVIKKQTESLLIRIQPIEQVVRSDKKYGRNDRVKVRYEDGREEVKKYKLVKEGIESGYCTIV